MFCQVQLAERKCFFSSSIHHIGREGVKGVDSLEVILHSLAFYPRRFVCDNLFRVFHLDGYQPVAFKTYEGEAGYLVPWYFPGSADRDAPVGKFYFFLMVYAELYHFTSHEQTAPAEEDDGQDAGKSCLPERIHCGGRFCGKEPYAQDGKCDAA